MFTLTVEDDQGRKTEVPFAPPSLTIGRAKDNQVRLNERNVSRKHARLSAGNGGIFIEDLDSYNGIRLNGDRISGKAAIYLGDRIQLGDFQLQVSGDTLRARPEEITQKTQLPRPHGMGDEVTNTEPMIVAPVGGQPGLAQTQPMTRPNVSADNGNGAHDNFDENTALIRLPDLHKAQNQSAQTLTGPIPKLMCVKGPMAGREWPISKTEVVIGRGAENDIQIDHRSMSRQHAKLVLAGNTCRIVDMGSANGTLVNGEQYAQVDLKKGDIIELGHVKLRVMWPGEIMPQVEQTDSAFDESTEISSRPRPRAMTVPTETAPLEKAANNRRLVIALAGGTLVAVITIVSVVMITAEPTPKPLPPPVQQPAIAQPQTPPAPQPPATPPPALPPTAPTQPSVDVGDILRRANAEMASENWDGAAKILERGLDQARGNTQLKTALERAEIERGNKTTFDDAMRSLKKKDMAGARDSFSLIPDSSVYYQRAQAKLQEPSMQRLAQSDKGRQPKTAQAKAPKERAEPTPPEPKAAKEEPKPVAQPETPPPQAGPTPREQAKKLVEQGNGALKQNKVKEAIELYVEASKTDPKWALPHRMLGIAHARAGNGEAAVEHYKIYLQLAPGASDANDVKKIIHDYESPGD